MSSTSQPCRRSDDFFATPEWVTRAILPHVLAGVDAKVGVLDPCCGEGAILDVVRASGKRPTFGIDIDAERSELAAKTHAVSCANALKVPWPRVPIVVMNPPFSLAEEFVRKAIAEVCEQRDLSEGGLFTPRPTVAVLLRLAFLESAKRIPLHRDHPSDIYPLAYRPSFTKNGKHDSCAYAWFLFGPGRGSKVRVLEDAPPSKERRPRATAAPPQPIVVLDEAQAVA